jgi:hypothetical protein
MSFLFTKTSALIAAAASASLIVGCASVPSAMGQSEGTTYTVTVKSDMAAERLAPILIVGDADDAKIWVGRYVSKEARTQFTTGNPDPLAAQLGGDQAQPGKLPAKSDITFTFRTKAATARITAMVHPDVTPDNYVTAKLDLSKPGTIALERFDIGDDEKRMTVERVGQVGTVTFSAK